MESTQVLLPQWGLMSMHLRPNSEPKHARRYALSDVCSGILITYLEDGAPYSAEFRLVALNNENDNFSIDTSSSQIDLIKQAGQILLPVVDQFNVSDEWKNLEGWCGKDIAVTHSINLLVVESTLCLRNAMHAALALAAAGGQFDEFEFHGIVAQSLAITDASAA